MNDDKPKIGFIPNPNKLKLSPTQRLRQWYRRWKIKQRMGMTRHCAMIMLNVGFTIEVWRDGKLIDSETKKHDLVVNAGLNLLCDVIGDFGGQGETAHWTAIGTDGTAPGSGQTALLAEVMRVANTYAKDAGDGDCSLDASFSITATYALQECGLLNAAAAGILFCRDIYTTKNVEDGDTVNVYYTVSFSAA